MRILKSVLLTSLLLLLSISCWGQVDQIHYLDNATLAWDAVTTDADGDPLLPGDVVSYEVYVFDYYDAPADIQNVSDLTFIGAPSVTEQVIDFTGFARTGWAAGVRAVVTDEGGAVYYSDIAWSTDPVATNPTEPFLYVPMTGVLILPVPTGLREAGM
jgi:hypothetical protein